MKKEYLFLTLTVLIWGSIHPIGKIILTEVTPFQFGLLRSGLAFLVLALTTILSGKLKAIKRMNRKDIGLCLLFGVFGFFLTQFFMGTALSRIPASVNGILANTTPLFIFILTFLFLREKVTKYKILGLIIGFLGMFLVIFKPEDWSFIDLVGASFSISMAIAWGMHTVGISKLMKKYGVFLVSTLTTLSGTILLLLVISFTDGFSEFFSATFNTKMLFLYAGIIATGIPTILYYYSLRRLNATKVGVFHYLVPIFAIIFSAIILGEPITFALIIGTVLIITGVRLVQKN